MGMAMKLGGHARMALYRPSDEAERINAAIVQVMSAERRSKSNVVRLLLAEALRARGYEV